MKGSIDASYIRNWISLWRATACLMGGMLQDCASLGEFEVALQRMCWQFPVLRLFVYVFVSFYVTVSQLAGGFAAASALEATALSSTSSAPHAIAAHAASHACAPEGVVPVPSSGELLTGHVSMGGAGTSFHSAAAATATSEGRIGSAVAPVESARSAPSTPEELSAMDES